MPTRVGICARCLRQGRAHAGGLVGTVALLLGACGAVHSTAPMADAAAADARAAQSGLAMAPSAADLPGERAIGQPVEASAAPSIASRGLSADASIAVAAPPRGESAGAQATAASATDTLDPRSADVIERWLGDRAVVVELRGPDLQALEDALGTVWGLMAAYGLDGDAPVFVHAADRRSGTVLAARLRAAGLRQVRIVTP